MYENKKKILPNPQILSGMSLDMGNTLGNRDFSQTSDIFNSH